MTVEEGEVPADLIARIAEESPHRLEKGSSERSARSKKPSAFTNFHSTPP
jgi:hypothetical protein